MAMPQVLIRLLLILSLVASSHTMMPQLLPVAAASSLVSSSASTPCISKCGEIDIPYPFGMGGECSWPGMDDGFNVTCNTSFEPPRAYLFGSVVEIINISVATNEMHIFVSLPAYRCYDSENTTVPGSLEPWWLNTTGTPFLISATQNVFTAIGCYTVAYLTGREDMSYLTGCITTCESSEEAAEQEGETCTGLGCCQTAIHANLSFVDVSWANDTNPAWAYSPCNYGFVAQKDWYHFSRRDLNGLGKDSFLERFGERNIPMVLDWAIRNNGSCKVGASGKLTAPACRSSHSVCVDATYGGGYICNCSKGYEGNPYMPDNQGGCTDIDECSKLLQPDSTIYGHCGPFTTCKNTDGDYTCKCNVNRKGVGKSDKGCDQYILSPYIIAAIAIGVAVILACFAVVLLQRRNKKKRFNNNGGKMLTAQGITIYSETDLKKIRKGGKYLGGGHFGEVYEGRIDGAKAQQVAVKYSKVASVARYWPKIIRQVVLPQDQEDDDGFVSEIIFQFKIRHSNVVKLIGCCLETDVPILVFEFVSNGSLNKMLHGSNYTPNTLPLLKRLDIAIGSAEALAYIHSHGDHIHGDIKPDNILLDENLNPKVSDFGSSKLLSVDSYFKGIVAGDLCYIDPLYTQTQRFTVKSDVYSFGIVLLELITRKTAIYDGNKRLSSEFVNFFRDNGSGRMMFDKDLCSGDDTHSERYMQCLDRIGKLAVGCLMLDDVDKRPTMAEVVEELKQVKEMASGGSSSSASEAS